MGKSFEKIDFEIKPFKMFSSGRIGMLGASTRAASSEWMADSWFGGDRRPGSKRSSKFQLKGAFHTATCYMGSGLVDHGGKPLHWYRHWRGVFGSWLRRTRIMYRGFHGRLRHDPDSESQRWEWIVTSGESVHPLQSISSNRLAVLSNMSKLSN